MATQKPSWTEGFIPGLATMARYDRSWFRPDLIAGVSVAAVAVPTAIAISQLAGVPPVNGLYASILPLVAYAFFGTSRQLIPAVTALESRKANPAFGAGDSIKPRVKQSEAEPQDS